MRAAPLLQFPTLSHPWVPLTTGRGQDHGLQHLCIKLVVGPGAGFITILGAGEIVTGSASPILPRPLPGPQIPTFILYLHPMPKTCFCVEEEELI